MALQGRLANDRACCLDGIALAGFGGPDFSASRIPSRATIQPPGDLIGKEVAGLVPGGIRNDQPEGARRIISPGHVPVERRSA